MRYSLLCFIIFSIVLQTELFTQESKKLQDLLWRNDFTDMIKNFGEEEITLHIKGREQKRIDARSYSESPGLRIQIFAGNNRVNAEKIARELKGLKLDSVYLVEESNLIKVQIGNFKEKLEAQKMIDRLRYAGVSNAWIVDASIHIPKPKTAPPAAPAEPDVSKEMLYAVQIFVTNDLEKARRLRLEISTKLPEDIWLLQSNGLWKIMAGKFSTSEAAESSLSMVKDAGFPEAWITQVMQ